MTFMSEKMVLCLVYTIVNMLSGKGQAPANRAGRSGPRGSGPQPGGQHQGGGQHGALPPPSLRFHPHKRSLQVKKRNIKIFLSFYIGPKIEVREN